MVRVLGICAVAIADRRYHVLVQVQEPQQDPHHHHHHHHQDQHHQHHQQPNQPPQTGQFQFRLWDLDDGHVLRSFQGHKSSIHQVVASVDARHVFSASEDATVKEWDVETATLVRTLHGHTGAVRCLQVSHHGALLVTGSWDRTLKIWNLNLADQSGGACSRTLGVDSHQNGHHDSINCVDFSRDHRFIASGSDDTSVIVWHVETGRILRRFFGHTARVTCVSFSFDGLCIASGSSDTTIRLWATTRTTHGTICLQEFLGHTDQVSCIDFSSDCQQLVSGSMDKAVRVWDINHGELVHTLQQHTDTVVSVAFSSLQRFAFAWRQYVISSSLDNSSLLWDLATGTCVLARLGYPGDPKPGRKNSHHEVNHVLSWSNYSNKSVECRAGTQDDCAKSMEYRVTKTNDSSHAVIACSAKTDSSTRSTECSTQSNGTHSSKSSTHSTPCGEQNEQERSSVMVRDPTGKMLEFKITQDLCAQRQSQRGQLFVGTLLPVGSSTVDTSTTPRLCVLKTFSPSNHKRFHRESDMLTEVTKFSASSRFVVDLIQTSPRAMPPNASTGNYLVLQRGNQNLLQLVQGSEADDLLDPPAGLIFKLARCVHFLHTYEFVHGGLRLEHLVNFGQQVPKFKLIAFGNCSRIRQGMEFSEQVDPEYCPPELAQYLCARNERNERNATNNLFEAHRSFDVWCFGILCLKLAFKGEPLIEFRPGETILERLAEESFNFHDSLHALQARLHWSDGLVWDILAPCLERDPTRRLTFQDIMNRKAMMPYRTNVQFNGPNDSDQYHLRRLQLPVFWALVPWEEAAKDTKKKILGNLKKLIHQRLELVLICEDAFEYLHEPNPIKCVPFEYDRTILRVDVASDFVEKCRPFLSCLALCFQCAGIAGALIPGLNGLGDAGKCLGDILDTTSLNTGLQLLDEMQHHAKIRQLHQEVKELQQQAALSNQNLLKAIHDQSTRIRREYLGPANQQAMLDLLLRIDSARNWSSDFVIGGLTKVKVKNKPLCRWVCKHHAASARYSKSPEQRTLQYSE